MRTKQTLSIVIAALLLLVTSLLTSCSELKTNLPPATSNSLQVHDDNWDNNPASSSFHAWSKLRRGSDRECDLYALGLSR
ncbi:MAG: hypothetical protein NTZ35_15905 [Ignavibacteriales bacterium]|nr:hypothetical protein [Ignavibacteriales bacterium]